MLRLNEHYVSFQGEGPNVGKLTQFVRFSGCNMRCPGWPCDTPHAVHPHLWKDDPKKSAIEVADQIGQMFHETGARHICLTGGEPMLQNPDYLRAMIMRVRLHSVPRATFDMFSNGSFLYPSWLLQDPSIDIVMDWKLPGSGEENTKLEEREANLRQLRQHDAVKFVCVDEADMRYAFGVYNDLKHVFRGKWYVGAAWDSLTASTIMKFVADNRLPWILNVQVHKYLFGEQRGV